MPKLSSVRRGEKTVPVAFGEVTVNVTYRPTDYTLDDLEAIQSRPEAERLRGFADMVADTIVSWDLEHEEDEILVQPTGEDGVNPPPVVRPRYIELTPESLRRNVPVWVLADIMQAVQRQERPDPEA